MAQLKLTGNNSREFLATTRMVILLSGRGGVAPFTQAVESIIRRKTALMAQIFILVSLLL